MGDSRFEEFNAQYAEVRARLNALRVVLLRRLADDVEAGRFTDDADEALKRWGHIARDVKHSSDAIAYAANIMSDAADTLGRALAAIRGLEHATEGVTQ